MGYGGRASIAPSGSVGVDRASQPMRTWGAGPESAQEMAEARESVSRAGAGLDVTPPSSVPQVVWVGRGVSAPTDWLSRDRGQCGEGSGSGAGHIQDTGV